MTDITTAPLAPCLLPPLWRIVGAYMTAPERTMAAVGALPDLGAPEALELYALVRDGYLNVLQWLATLPVKLHPHPYKQQQMTEIPKFTSMFTSMYAMRWRPRSVAPYKPIVQNGIRFKQYWWNPAEQIRPIIFTKVEQESPLEYEPQVGVMRGFIHCETSQRTLTFCAAMSDRVEFVDWLITALPSSPPCKFDTYRHVVVRSAEIRTLEMLRHHGWNFRDDYTGAIAERAQGALPALRWLVKAGGRVNVSQLRQATDHELVTWANDGYVDGFGLIDGPRALRKYDKLVKEYNKRAKA